MRPKPGGRVQAGHPLLLHHAAPQARLLLLLLAGSSARPSTHCCSMAMRQVTVSMGLQRVGN